MIIQEAVTQQKGEADGSVMVKQEKIRVLIVDDHHSVRGVIGTLLRKDPGIVVVGEAAGGVEAVEKSKQLLPDVILMDIRMPGVDGLAATRLIKQLPTPPKVLVITQYEDAEYADAASSAGGDGFLPKKNLGSELISTIHSLLPQ